MRHHSNELAPLDDLGNAQRFVIQHRSRVLFCPGIGWLVWDEKRFKADTQNQVQELAKDTVRSIVDEAGEPGTKLYGEVLGWAKSSARANRIKVMADLASSDPEIVIDVDDLDRDPHLFAVANGTLDLRSGKLLKHNPDHRITKLSPVAYEPMAQSQLLNRFLKESTGGDVEVLAYLQKCGGYSMLGVCPEECFLFVYGPPASGKSTLVRALETAFGDYARTSRFELFQVGRDGESDGIARLAGCRLVTASESHPTRRFDEGLINALTGGERIVGRHLYQASFEFTPKMTLWLTANDRPTVGSARGGIWRRIREIDFSHAVPATEQDPAIKAELTDPDSEAARAMLAFLVKGCQHYLDDGHLDPPVAVRQATEEYRAEEDLVGRFILECCEKSPPELEQTSCYTRDLFGVYQAWAAAAGERSGSEKRFARELDNLGFHKKHDRESRRSIRCGIKPTDDAREHYRRESFE